MIKTHLNIRDKLPLTCSRTGTCCHGNNVFLNPWELACIAREKQISPKEFRDQYCDLGGIRLRFNGKNDQRGKAACSQYIDNFGCSVHIGRPLACRLFPLGRQIQSERVQYIFQGNTFPCLDGCPEVIELPHLSVGEYLEGQLIDPFEKAQDEYLEVMQNIADIAFTLLLDIGLAASGDTRTLTLWRTMGNEQPDQLADRIDQEWIESLLFPDFSNEVLDPISFIHKHNELLQEKAQEKFGSLQTNDELHEASVLMMGIALLLGRSLGADPKVLSEHWIDIAKENGALEK